MVLEAGMAFVYDPDRTIIVEMGRIQEISEPAAIEQSSPPQTSP